ncbi:MAG: glucose-1-phosphate adenylyltransferase, partial [Candidatus Omnitrophica bacterium]|nr:glucose-1-phosphate adenylyltransferase [Candidatus Omnitrophota bacterium]
EAREYGILKLDKGGRISGFKEKPRSAPDLTWLEYIHTGSSAPSFLASMGVYLFDADILIKVLKTNDIDFGREVIPNSIGKFRSLGYVFDDYWKDLGGIRSFYDANMELAQHKPYLGFFYRGCIFTRPRFLPSAIIRRSTIKDSVITEGCVIKDAVIKDSIIGLRNIIGRGCRITRTVVIGADYYDTAADKAPIKIGIGDNTIIDKAIVDKNARIGRNVIIRNTKKLKTFDGDNYFIRDGIVIIPKNSIIKDGTKI